MTIDFSQTKDKTIAFISSYDEICGNATYTKQLMEEAKPYFKCVDIIKLDQFLIHSEKGAFFSIAKNDVLSKINNYEYINIQFEPGLFHSSPRKGYKFIFDIVNNFNGKQISFTCHSLNFHPDVLKLSKILKIKLQYSINRILKRSKKINSHKYHSNLFMYKINKLMDKKDKKNISFITHSRELEKITSLSTKIPVFCHPIVSATSQDIAKYNQPSARDVIINRYNLNPSKKYVGMFGFGNFYKGFDIAIKTMKYLPDDYHLVISSNVHPSQNIKPRKFNLNNIIKNENPVEQDNYMSFLNTVIKNEEEKYGNLMSRIHYINHIIDEELFKELIAGIDIVVLPYYEVGQEGSGPLSYATFLNYGGKIILSRTGIFERYSRNFFPECFTFFDQGNEIELANKIQTVESKKDNLVKNMQNYNPTTNIQTYIKSLGL